MRRKLFAAVLMAVLAVVQCVSTAEAKIKVTVNNKRSHRVAVAFCWDGFDMHDDRRSGWYIVQPGQSRVVTLKNAVYALTSQGFGYYAQGRHKGKKVVWKGNFRSVIIHPSKKFSGHPDAPIQGGIKVGFRKLKLRCTSDNRMDGAATLTLK